MITIRHQTILLPNKGLDIIEKIRPKTTNFRWLFGNSFFRYYSEIDKPWFGKLRVKEKDFKIRRNGLGLFIDQLSLIIVKGTVIEDQGQTKLDVKYKLTVIHSLFLLAIVVILLISPWLTDNNLTKQLLGTVYFIGASAWTIRDFLITKKQFNQLIREVIGNEPQQNA